MMIAGDTATDITMSLLHKGEPSNITISWLHTGAKMIAGNRYHDKLVTYGATNKYHGMLATYGAITDPRISFMKFILAKKPDSKD